MSDKDPLGLFEDQKANDPLGLFSEKPKTTFGQDIGIGLKQFAHSTKDVLDLFAGAAAGTFGSSDEADAIYADMEARKKAFQTELEGVEQGIGGKIASGVTQLVPALATGGIVGGARGAMLVPSGINAISGSGENVQQGASLPAAIGQAGLEAGIDYTTMALPAGKGLLKGMGWGAGGNVIGQGATDVAGQMTMKDTDAAKRYEITPEKYAVSAGTGAFAGGVFGGMAGKDPQVKVELGKSQYDKPKLDVPQTDYKVMQDVDNAIAVRNQNIKAIEERLARQEDPDSDYALKLKEDLVKQTYELTELQAYKGELVNLVPDNTTKTDVEAPRIDEQLQVEYAAREAELNALESEYRDLSKKGAALTAEQRTRLQEVEARYAEVSDFLEQNAGKMFGEEPEVKQNQQVEGDTEAPRQSFEPLHDRVSVNEAVMTRDYSNFSPSVLEKMLDNKQRKIDEVYQSVLDHGLGSPEGQRAFAFLDTLKEEYAKIEAEYNKKLDQQQRSESIPTPSLNQELKLIDGTIVKASPVGKEWLDGSGNLIERTIVKEWRNVGDSVFYPPHWVGVWEQSKDGRTLIKRNTIDYDFNQVAAQKVSWELAEPLLKAIQEGGIRGGLAYLAKQKGDTSLSPFGRYLGELAQKLHDNPLVGHGKFVEDPNFQHAGGYDNISGYVHMKGDATSTPGVFLHEVVHSAVNRAIALHEKGLLKDPKQSYAVKQLDALFNSLKSNKKHYDTLKRFLKDDIDVYLENLREFVAYGISDQRMMLALQKIKLGETSVYSKLTNAIKNLLNLNKNERTALDDVLRYSEILMDASEGVSPGFNPNTRMDFAKITTPQRALEAIKSGSLKIFAHAFTQNLRQMMRPDPYFSAMEERISKAERAKEYLVRTINYGVDSFQTWQNKGKFFFKTTGSEDTAALVPSMYKLKGKEIHSVYSTLVDGYRNGVDALETIKANEGSWTPEQLNFAHALNNAAEKLWQSSIKMLANKGLDYTKLKQRIGYMLTSRVGDYATQVRVNGVLVRQQHFLTEAEAKHWANEMKKTAGDARVVIETAKVDDIKQGNATTNLKDFIDTLKGMTSKEAQEFIDTTASKLEEENANIGSHTIQSNIVSGFIGDQIGMSSAAMGEQLRTALPRMVDNYAQNIMSRSIQKDYIDFLIDNEHKMNPTTKDLLGFYISTQIGLPYEKGTARDLAHGLSQKLRENVDTLLDSKLFGFHNRDKHAVDRFMGLFSNAFYISNILMKPAIWVAQPLQALNSLRSAFKEGETPRQVMMAFGETMMQLSLGKQYLKNNPDLEKAIYDASQKGNVLHPQMVNDYNDMRIGTDPNSFLNQTIDTISGKKISAWGDRASRYASFLFFYNLHKRSGLSGDELTRVASRDATENMVAYGSKKLPAIYREMGIVGEQGATLATFAHTQLGNMIIDIKEFVQQPGARSAAPLIMTAAVTSLLGGAIALPIIAEYELLRQAGIKAGWWGPDSWPNVSEMIMDNAPRWLSMGGLSHMTGIDMDASMRYTSLFNKIADIEEQGLIAFAPHLAWGKQVVSNLPTAFSPSATVPERDQALKKVLPKGPVSGAVDQVRNNGDLFGGKGPLFTRMGKRGQGGVERDLSAKLAPWVGSQTTKQAMDTRKQLASKERDAAIDALVEKAVQYAVHGDSERASATIERMLVKAKGYSKQDLDRKIESQIAKINIEGIFNNYVDPRTGQSSPDQEARMVRDNLGEYLKRREGR